MKRVLIIGCGGSGKSTLARLLGEKTGLPVVHLDQIFWAPGNWQHLDRESFDRLLQEEVEKDRWILDGNYDRTLEKRLAHCDTVIWLDYNRFVCLIGWVKRVISNWGTARADMAAGCTEWFDPEFAGWIWRFNKEHRVKYTELLDRQDEKLILRFKSRSQLKKYIATL